MSAFRGQTIRIYFLGTEDSSLQTSFVIDDTSSQRSKFIVGVATEGRPYEVLNATHRDKGRAQGGSPLFLFTEMKSRPRSL